MLYSGKEKFSRVPCYLRPLSINNRFTFYTLLNKSSRRAPQRLRSCDKRAAVVLEKTNVSTTAIELKSFESVGFFACNKYLNLK